MISEDFSVERIVAMHDVAAFDDHVAAYPAIAVIRRARQGEAVIAEATAAFGQRESVQLRRWARSGDVARLRSADVDAARLPSWFAGSSSWPSGSPEELALIADLEARFPLLEDRGTGTRVGIGVATGADSVFLTDDQTSSSAIDCCLCSWQATQPAAR